MTELITRSFALDRRNINHEERSIEIVASSESIDAHGEVVVQDWEEDGRMSRFNAYGPVLFQHNMASGPLGGGKASDKIPIGRAENARVEGGVLKAKLFFADEKVSELAERVWHAIKGGFMGAFSVGFISGDVRLETRNDRDVWVLSKNTLCEISVVDIPCNPDAVIEQRKKSIEQLRRLVAPQETSNTATAKAATETAMPLIDILAKSLNVEANESVIVSTIETQSKTIGSLKSENEALRADVAKLQPKAAVANAAVATLALDEAMATEATVAKNIGELQSKSKKFDELEPQFKAAQAKIAEHDEAAIKSDVAWVFKCGEKNLYGVKGGSLKGLEVYRRSDPAGFAEEYKAALDGRKAYDDTQMFAPVSKGAGPAAINVAQSVPTSTGDATSFDSRVDALIRAKAAAGIDLARSVAIDMVARGQA